MNVSYSQVMPNAALPCLLEPMYVYSQRSRPSSTFVPEVIWRMNGWAGLHIRWDLKEAREHVKAMQKCIEGLEKEL